MVKKVPGTLHFTARGDGHTFEPGWLNVTHHVHAFFYGARPSPRKERTLRALHPLGASPSLRALLLLAPCALPRTVPLPPPLLASLPAAARFHLRCPVLSLF